MRMRRFLASVLILTFLCTMTVSVHAEGASPYNVLYMADIQYVGLGDPTIRNGIYQDIYYLVDNEWAMGSQCEQGNYAAKIGGKARYDINGNFAANGEYAAIITFTLSEASTVAGFRLIHPDVTGAAGVSDPLDFLLTNFDVLGSDSGEEGTWKVLYEARDLRDGGSYKYEYEGIGFGSNGLPFYSYGDRFAEEMKVTHVALAIHTLNLEKNSLGAYMNIHEFQAFTPDYYTAQDTETEETEAPTVETDPPKEPVTLSDLLPKSPIAITAVAATLATVCAVGCVLHERKKEKKD